MTTPALRAVKQAVAGRRLTLLTSPAGAELDGLMADVDETLVYESPWMKATPLRSGPDLDLGMIEALRARHFDAAIIFTVFSQNPLPAAMLCYLAGIPLRLAHCRENPYQLLTDWVAETEPHEQLRHEVQRQLDLVAAVGCEAKDQRLRLTPTSHAVQSVDHLLRQLQLADDHRWMVLHAGASAPSRRYPPELFAEVASRLIADHGLRVVLTGSEAERELVASIQARTHGETVSLAGKLNLAELAALVARAPVLLANNTGPVHVAAAVGTPVVVLYALTNPQHTPWCVPHRVLYHDVPCKYCFKSVCREEHHDCLRRVTPEEVVAAVLEMLVSGRESDPQPVTLLPRSFTESTTKTPALS